jgi:hypothetical protein
LLGTRQTQAHQFAQAKQSLTEEIADRGLRIAKLMEQARFRDTTRYHIIFERVATWAEPTVSAEI